MEIVLGLFAVGFVILIGFYCMRESDETRRRKEYAAERIRRMQEDRDRVVQEEYMRQAARVSYPSRTAPVTTGKPTTKASPRSSGGSTELKRHDNSFDNVVDSYSAPAYTPSHSSSSYSSHSSCSSSSSSSDSGSSSSSSSSCD
jgi:hypothetical protein